MLAASISFPFQDLSVHAKTLETRMEAAAEALLRVRDEVVAALDRQVGEIQQLHRALACPPPPMIVVQDVPAVVQPSAVYPSTVAAVERAVFFDEPPACAPVAPVAKLPAPTVEAPIEMSGPFTAAPAAVFVETLAAAVVSPPFCPPTAALGARAEGLAAPVPDDVAAEAGLDPFLERATLEELNDALASAFAMVSSRSFR